MSKSQHGKHVANVQWKIARHLNRGEAVPAGLAQNLAALLVERAALAPRPAPEHAATRGTARRPYPQP